ncbi:hypothetical protein [Clostridium butyricum]
MELTKFGQKLNKLDGNIYTIEEEVNLVNGVYEADLEHDNINVNTLSVYTGSMCTGDKINTYKITTPSLTPWRRHIKIYSTEPKLYITYETVGDIVEADDINDLQDVIGGTQTAINEEINRATNAEKVLQDNIDAEVTRATNTEQALQTTIDTNKPIWDDKYTKAEVDNKMNLLTINMTWKDAVDTYDDIATTYPTAQDGWTVFIKDTGFTYRYNDGAWVQISTYNLPLATASNDGRMSKEDKSFLDTVKSLWTSITTHISDAVKHITSAERTLWNTVKDKADKIHTHEIADITDMPTKLSEFTNDEGYVKSSDTNTTPFYKATELSANSYKVVTGFSKTSLSDGYNLRVSIPTDATGATSLTVDSVTAPIKLSDGADVSDLKAGGVYALTYYNGNFICASAGGGSAKVDTVNFTSDMLLTGYTANGSDGKAIEGTMVNNGSPTATLNCDGTYNIQEGYYSGGTITANSLASQTADATAGALQIVPPYTAYVNGQKVTGTMNVMPVDTTSTDGVYGQANANNFAYGVYSKNDTNPYVYLGIPQWSYTTKNSWVRYPASSLASNIGLTADKIVAGNTILGVTGTAGGMGELKMASGTGYPTEFLSGIYGCYINPGFTPTVVYGVFDTLTLGGDSTRRTCFASFYNPEDASQIFCIFYGKSASKYYTAVEPPSRLNNLLFVPAIVGSSYTNYSFKWYAIG